MLHVALRGRVPHDALPRHVHGGVVCQIARGILDEQGADNGQDAKGDGRPEDALEGVRVGFPEGGCGGLLDGRGDAGHGGECAGDTDGVLDGGGDQGGERVGGEVEADGDVGDACGHLLVLDAVEDGVEDGIAHAAATAAEGPDQAGGEAQVAERHVQAGNDIAQQRDQRKHSLAEELERHPARAVVGDHARVSPHKDGLDRQHHDHLQFEVPDVAHEQGGEAAEEHLANAVGERNDADLDRVACEHIQRPLREQPCEGIEDSPCEQRLAKMFRLT